MTKYYLLKDEHKQLQFSKAQILDVKHSNVLHDPLRVQIMQLLDKKAMYAAEIAAQLKLHEQKVYYHINKLVAAEIIEVVERTEIRGTVSKKYKPTSMHFGFSLKKDWKDASELFAEKKESVLDRFFSPFISEGVFDGFVVVGSPDPHGPNKRRTRDGHYAIDLSLFLGKLCSVGESFSVLLDVDVKGLQKEGENLIVVGGPVTNLISAAVQEHLPVKFMKEEHWGIVTKKGRYGEESMGLIARIPNPFAEGKWILFLAGVSSIGTKAAVLALTRHYNELFVRFSSQKKWYAVVNGFDLDGDGRIDSVEVLE